MVKAVKKQKKQKTSKKNTSSQTIKKTVIEKPSPAFKRDMPVGEAASVFPEAANIMLSYGLHCIGCGMNAFESIEQGCMGHGMGDEEIDSLVAELNEAYEEFMRNKE